jgi:acetyl-CoA carboxylase carboxyltransferase component
MSSNARAMKISNEAAQLPYQERLDAEFNSREEKALAMGGSVKLLARAEQGILDARSRVEVLVDEGSFVELGKFAISSF